MAGGVTAGRLNIQIVAEISRLQQDLDRAKRAVRSASGTIAASTRAANDNLSSVGRAFNASAAAAERFGRTTVVVQRATGGLTAALRSVAAAAGIAGAGMAARTFLSLADSYKQITAQLKLATAEFGSFGKAQEDVRRIAAETRGGLDETTKLYATFARLSGELGISQKQVADITKTVNQAFKVSGATTSEASNAIRQLSQAFASGVLRGDEFNSMMENAPRLSKLLADSLGVPVGALRTMASEGQLTAEKLTRALSDTKFTAGLDEEFRQLPVTFDESMGQVKNAAILTFGAFDRGGEFSTAISNFILDGSNGFRDLEAGAENLGIEIRATMAGLADVFEPFVQGAFEAFDVVGDASRSLADRIRPLLGEIDAITNWGSQQGLIGRLASGGSVSDWWNERPARGGTTLLRDFDKGYDRAYTDRAMAKVMRGDPFEYFPELTGGSSSARGAVSAADAAKKAAAAKKAQSAAAKEAAKAEREAQKALNEVKRAYEQAFKTAENYTNGLEKQTAEIGKTAIEIKRMEVAAAALAAEQAALKAPTQAAAKALRDQAQAIRDAGAAWETATVNEVIKEYDKLIVSLEDELSIMGLVGAEREKHLLMMEKEQFLLDYAAVGIQRATEMWEEYVSVRLEGIDKKSQMERDLEVARALTDQMDALISGIGRTRGMGGIVGDLGMILTAKNPVAEMLSMGGIGTIAGSLLGGSEITEKMGAEFTKSILKTFPKLNAELAGDIGGTLANVFQGAGIGTAVGGVIGGGKGGQIGSSLGGALGQAVGSKVLSSLGAAAGPVGAIAGAVLGNVVGSLVGGLVKKNKTGKATISGSGVSLSGNSSSRKGTASDMAGSVQDALDQIASALGADLDMALGKVTVAVRNKSLRVDPTGGGNTKIKKGAVDFGQDQEAALKYAISDLLSDGVLGDLPQIIANAINGKGDLEKRVQDALSIKGVFDYLEQAADPLAFAMKGLDKELAALKSTFTGAGASAEDLAKLEEYSAKRRLEITEEYNREAIEKAKELAEQKRAIEITIMTMQGRVTEALTLARNAELEAMDASLRPLQEQAYALADAAQKRELEIQLMEALGLATEAEAARRQDYLNTLPESLRGLQNQIYAALDAKKALEAATEAQEAYNSKLSSAKSDLISAYNREASALQNTIDRFRNFGDTLREFRASLYGADSGLASTRSLLVTLMKVGAQAAAGSEAGFNALPGAGRDYLSSLKNTATSKVEYERGVALVAGYADKAISSADSQANAAVAQLKALEKSVSALVNIEEDVLTVADTMKVVKDLLANPVVPAEPTPVALPEDYVSASNDAQQKTNDTLSSIERTQDRRLEQLSAQVERLTQAVVTLAGNSATSTAIIRRAVDPGGAWKTREEVA